ncbi:MAG: 16S rRNA (cytidine(1402)-2'-O)-methyltransferase [Clostridia bacterium]
MKSRRKSSNAPESSPSGPKPGTLYLCATPIGNLQDITLRALSTLRGVAWIAAEDTRRTLKLLNHFEIAAPLISVHEHNEEQRAAELVERLRRGEDGALVSDAGTPLLSDPGFLLVQRAIEEGIPIVPLPGPSALLAALIVSGLPPYPFYFGGFLPRKSAARARLLKGLADLDPTLVFYEAPHRLRATLRDMLDVWGDRPACIARELTKAFEQWQRQPLSRLVAYWEEHPPRGEFVIVVAGADRPAAAGRAAGHDAGAADRGAAEGGDGQAAPSQEVGESVAPDELAQRVLLKMSMGMDKKTAVQAVASELGLPRRVVYQAATVIDAAPVEPEESG